MTTPWDELESLSLSFFFLHVSSDFQFIPVSFLLCPMSVVPRYPPRSLSLDVRVVRCPSMSASFVVLGCPPCTLAFDVRLVRCFSMSASSVVPRYPPRPLSLDVRVVRCPAMSARFVVPRRLPRSLSLDVRLVSVLIYGAS